MEPVVLLDAAGRRRSAATVDRLLHHAHVLLTDDTDSHRLAQATAGKGVSHGSGRNGSSVRTR